MISDADLPSMTEAVLPLGLLLSAGLWSRAEPERCVCVGGRAMQGEFMVREIETNRETEREREKGRELRMKGGEEVGREEGWRSDERDFRCEQEIFETLLAQT